MLTVPFDKSGKNCQPVSSADRIFAFSVSFMASLSLD
jgi:hypothetical protein